MRLVSSVRALIVFAALSTVATHGAGAQDRPNQGRAGARLVARPDSSVQASGLAPARATPPRVQVAPELAILAPPASAPSPATIRRAAVPSRELTPTPPVVLPPSPGSPPPDAALRRAPEAVVTPPPIERPAPPPRSLRAEVQPLQAVMVSQTEPVDATGRCKDGTFLTGPVTEDRCVDKGGLAILIPARRVAPPRPLVTP